jgi:hypothetical protein
MTVGIVVAGSATCFVSVRECSEIPCTELIGSTMSTAAVSRATLVAPSVRGTRLATPLSGCGTRRPLPRAAVVALPGATRSLASPDAALLANMSHRLAAHPPTRP